MKRWIEPQKIEVSPQFEAAVGGLPLVARTLARRGLQDLQVARGFLDPGHYSPATPGEMPGMQVAVDRLERAIHAGETILVWGDFDVDGQTSTALLVSALRDLGARAVYHIPVRAEESHGVNLPFLKHYLDRENMRGSGVMLTCDTGIAANEALNYAQAQKVDVIITDHHDLPPSLPPALAIVNPKLLPAGHPLATLPGVGVAYQLAAALYARVGNLEKNDGLLDLVAMGIVADLALQTGDTRYLLQQGLGVLRRTERTGLQIMMEIAELDPHWLTEEHISFILAPRLNSLGRLSDANPVVDFLTTQDEARARVLALDMEGLNARRKMLTDQVFQAAIAQIDTDRSLLDDPVLVLAHPAWPAGVIGIVASKLVERYSRPVVLLSSPPGELGRGSARSVEGIHITTAIAAQADLLAGFGGHPMAAGLSIDPDRIPEFRRRLSRMVEEMLGETVLEAVLQVDGYLPLSELSMELVADLERLAPFGPGNPPLVLASRDLRLADYASLGRYEEHMLLTVEDEDGNKRHVVWWQGAHMPLPEGKFDLAYSVRTSTYRGQRDLQVEWLDARPYEGTEIMVSGRKRLSTVIDYRHTANPFALLQQLRKQGQIQVWCEGADIERVGGVSRTGLSPGAALAIWTSPPGRIELQQALETVAPETVYLFAVDPEMDRSDTFIKRLAGLVKHVLNARSGVAELVELSAATAQCLEAVRAGVNLLQANGYIKVDRQEGDILWLEQGDGVRKDDSILACEVLKQVLRESAAYRAYYTRADADGLIEPAEEE